MIGGQENVSDAKRVRNQKTQCRGKKMMKDEENENENEGNDEMSRILVKSRLK